jgi:hypothetical protein
VRKAAYMTVAEVCFVLACRATKLAAELGSPDLFGESYRGAIQARRAALSLTIRLIEQIYRAVPATVRLKALMDLVTLFPVRKDELEPWVQMEIESKAKVWIEELEAAMSNGTHAADLIRLLPPFYEALGIEDSPARTERLRQRGIQLLIKDRQFASALEALRVLPERQPKLEAICHEGLQDLRKAAECYQLAGDLKAALTCFRTIPDLAAALELLPRISDGHPAGDSLQWMAKIQKLIAERPDKFTKVTTPAERKLLEDMLERALGVTKRKPAAPGAKRAPAVRKTVPKASTKAATRPRPRRPGPDEELF